jgi:hypothetical protein
MPSCCSRHLLLSFDSAHIVWTLLNIPMAVLAPYYAARFFRPHEPFRVIVLPILLFLCWNGTRTLTQYTLLPLMFSMLALLVAVRRPVAGGMWLGLAPMKPQVALPVFLWSTFTRRWSVVLTSLAVVGVLAMALMAPSSSSVFKKALSERACCTLRRPSWRAGRS